MFMPRCGAERPDGSPTAAGGWHRPSWRAQDPAVSPDSRLKRIGAVRIRFAPSKGSATVGSSPAAMADAPPQVAGNGLSRNGRLRILPSPKPAIPHPPAPKAPPRRRRRHQDGTLQEDGEACRTMAPDSSAGPRWVGARGSGEAGARTGPWPWPGWRSSCRWVLPPSPAGQIPPAPPSPSA